MPARTTLRRVAALAFAVLAVAQPGTAARTAAAGPRQHAPAAPGGASSAGFAQLSRDATRAREAGRLTEAIGLYQKALRLKPAWQEGRWYLATSYYELDQYEDARNAFRRVVDQAPANGPAWTFKGLCEFQLRNYETALADLAKGRTLGLGGNRELLNTSQYHLAILLSRMEQYEQGVQMLTSFVQEGNDSERIVEALGIATLRIPVLPSELPGDKREPVMIAGRAEYFRLGRMSSAAENAYKDLVTRYGSLANVHYAYGVFLVNQQPEAGVAEFQQELRLNPHHTWAKMQLAFEYLRRSDWPAARDWSQQAVDEAPTLFVARKTLGQALLELGDVDGAIAQLEVGLKLAPDSPSLHFTLARAYRRAGRTADAEREQAEFAKLDRELRTERTGAQSVGGIDSKQ